MVLILLVSKRLRRFGHEVRTSTMRHQNSVFHDILKHVPWDAFDRLVKEHGADWRVWRLSTKDQFIALLYGQLSGASSLREIAGGLESHSARLYHVGSRPAQRSTLADANARRPAAVFSGLFAEMAGRAHRGLRRKLGEAKGMQTGPDCPVFGRLGVSPEHERDLLPVRRRKGRKTSPFSASLSEKRNWVFRRRPQGAGKGAREPDAATRLLPLPL